MAEELDKQTIVNLERAIKELTRALTTGGPGTTGTVDTNISALFEAERDAFTKTILRGRKTISEYSHHLKELRKLSERMAKLEVESAKENAEELEVIRRKMRTTLDVMADNFQQASGVVTSLKHQMNLTRQTAMANAKSYHQAAHMADLLAKSLNDGASAAVKSVRAASMLHASQIDETDALKNAEVVLEYRTMVEQLLNKAIKSGASELVKQLGLLNEVTGELRDNITLQELSDFRLALGEFDASVIAAAESVDALREAGALDLRSLVSAALEGTGEEVSQATSALAQLAADLSAKGMLDDFVKELENERVTVSRVVEKTDELGNVFTTIEETAIPAIEALTETIIDASGQQKRVLKRNTVEIQNILATSRDNIKLFSEKLLHLGKTVDDTRESLDSVSTYFSSAWGQLTSNIRNGTEILKRHVKGLSSYAAVVTYATKALRHFTKTYQEAVAFNTSQVAASFIGVTKMAWNLGMSFDDTTRFLKENGRLLSQVGPEGFNAGINKLEETFRQFGYNMEQGAELVGPAIEQGLYAGINTQNLGELNKYIKQTMSSFQRVSSIIGVSAKEYMQLNSQLLSAEGTFDVLMGMDKVRRKAFADEIIARRDMYVTQGLTVEKAQELVKLQMEAMRIPIKERARNAAMAMARAQLAGLGPEQAMEIYRLRMKGRLTNQEQARLQELTKLVAVGVERRKTQEYELTGGFFSTLAIAEDAGLQLSGAAAQAEKLGLEQQAAADAGKALTAEQARNAAELAKGSAFVADLSQKINQLTSVISTSWIAGIISSTAALGGLAASALLASKHLAVLAGKNLIGGLGNAAGGGIAEKAGTIGGKLGKLARAGGKLLGKITPFAALGAMAYEGISAVAEIERQKAAGEITAAEATTKQAGNLGMVAGGGIAGLLGAGLGQALLPIPGLGAALGATVGAALGGWLGRRGGEAAAEATTKQDGNLGMVAGSGVAGLLSAGLGQALLPIPELGAALGATAGAALGGWLGRRGGEAAVEATIARPGGRVTRTTSIDSIPGITGAGAVVNMVDDKRPVINLPELLKVTDDEANSKLAVLVTHVAAAVDYLKDISVTTGKSANRLSSVDIFDQGSTSRLRIPTTNSYLTGRA